MGNPYFNTKYNPYNPEHYLYNNATNEIIQQSGIDMYYIPIKLIKKDHVFGEDVLSSFEQVFEICLYIENFTGFDGGNDLFSKFGLTIEDKLTLITQQDEFNDIVDDQPDVGDLIFHEASRRIFEVTFVETDDSFWQHVGTNMSYKLTCKLFVPSSENFETGIDEIDQFTTENNYSSDDESEQVNNEKVNNIDFSETDIFGNL